MHVKAPSMGIHPLGVPPRIWVANPPLGDTVNAQDRHPLEACCRFLYRDAECRSWEPREQDLVRLVSVST